MDPIMVSNFHFLRPWWFLALLPAIVLFGNLLRGQIATLQGLSALCDMDLLKHLVYQSGQSKRRSALVLWTLSYLFLVVSLAGPTWSKYPVSVYQSIAPRVLVLDMSDAMLERDLKPDRLTRAKFKLHDLLTRTELAGQTGLVVFTSQTFVVSPLTEDANTIDSLVESLTPQMMPVTGYRLERALGKAADLLHQAGYAQGQILVLSAEPPNVAGIEKADQLAREGIITSVIAVQSPAQEGGGVAIFDWYKRLARAGQGVAEIIANDNSDLTDWSKLEKSMQQHQIKEEKDKIPVWRDQGRWFLIPALLFFLPAFWRRWIDRVML